MSQAIEDEIFIKIAKKSLVLMLFAPPLAPLSKVFLPHWAGSSPLSFSVPSNIWVAANQTLRLGIPY